MKEQLTVEKTWWSRVKMKSNKIERIAYNMGDKSKKNILIFLAIRIEQLKDIVCMFVVNHLFALHHKFIFVLFVWKKTKGVWRTCTCILLQRTFYLITRDNQIASVFQSSQCVIKLYFCNKQQMKNQQLIPKLKTLINTASSSYTARIPLKELYFYMYV